MLGDIDGNTSVVFATNMRSCPRSACKIVAISWSRKCMACIVTDNFVHDEKIVVSSPTIEQLNELYYNDTDF